MKLYYSLLLGLCFGFVAQAQPQDCDPDDPQDLLCKRFQLERLELAGASGDFVTTEGTNIPEAKNLSFKVLTSFQKNPLTVKAVINGELQKDSIPIVSEQTVMQFGGMMGLGKQMAAGLIVPVIVSQAGDGLNQLRLPSDELSSAGIGDIRLLVRYRVGSWELSPEQNLSVGTSAMVSVPMSQILTETISNDFFGERTPTFTPKVSAELTQGPLRFGANLGYRIKPKSNLLSLTINDELLYNLAASYQATQELSAAVELFGGVSSIELSEVDQRPAELAASARYAIKGGFYGLGGGGFGISNGAMSPQFRVFLSLGFDLAHKDKVDSDEDGIFDNKDKCPDDPEIFNNVDDEDGCPDDTEKAVVDENDEDADDISNAKDKCLDKPEDKDGFEDDDGCPEFDNDQDGILDKDEKCDNEAEDKDGFEDEDGCPDLNNDGDAFEDTADKCPNEVEDVDGHADQDGCPEADADNDAYLDEADSCPDAAETINGVTDEDGCPDEGAASLTFPAGNVGEIVGADKIRFQFGKVQLVGDSLVVLDELVSRMRLAKDSKLLITVSPEKKGGKYADEIAKARAEVLQRYLVGFGIESDRVTTSIDTKNTGTVTLTLSATPPKPAPTSAPVP